MQYVAAAAAAVVNDDESRTADGIALGTGVPPFDGVALGLAVVVAVAVGEAPAAGVCVGAALGSDDGTGLGAAATTLGLDPPLQAESSAHIASAGHVIIASAGGVVRP